MKKSCYLRDNIKFCLPATTKLFSTTLILTKLCFYTIFSSEKTSFWPCFKIFTTIQCFKTPKDF